MALIHYQHCPVCGSDRIRKILDAKDYTVSGEFFAVYECAACSLRFTQDVPDAESIGPYYQSDNYISHTDTRKGLINRVYHIVREYTLKQKRKLLVEVTGKTRGKVLDIGAGTGAFLNEMREAGWNITGLEPDPGARLMAKEKYNLEFGEPTILFSLPSEERYDAITLWHVLEHVHDLHTYISRIANLLNEGGKLVLALPNYTSSDAVKYGAHWAAYDVPRHLYHFSPAAVSNLLAQHGLKINEMRPMWFDPFYISMLSEQYKNGHSSHISALVSGIKSNKEAFSRKESASSVIYIASK
jgi:2-polyprenyl-3-methyl-5-hydroxy-6-metoxy-1,4-benzoquinol methylase